QRDASGDSQCSSLLHSTHRASTHAGVPLPQCASSMHSPHSNTLTNVLLGSALPLASPLAFTAPVFTALNVSPAPTEASPSNGAAASFVTQYGTSPTQQRFIPTSHATQAWLTHYPSSPCSAYGNAQCESSSHSTHRGACANPPSQFRSPSPIPLGVSPPQPWS